MKTPEEINENLEGSKAKLQESYDNMAKFAATLNNQTIVNYKRTQSYIKGWIDALSNKPSQDESNSDYTGGHKNGLNWMNS